jgi:poly-gamma-glutamate synthesis protein (capsule biosynthesis protein)
MKRIKLCAVGDIMPGGVFSGIDKRIKLDAQITDYLNNADIRLATLETAIGEEETFIEEKVSRLGDLVYSKDDDLKRLVELNINVVNLANNHIFDLGKDGISHVIDLLDKLGIKHFGAGLNLEEAKRPAVFNINGKKIALVGFCDWRNDTTGWCLMATETTPGVNPLFGDYEQQIKNLKLKYDYVIVVPHWGKEHTFWPTNHVVKHAKKMIKAGADVVIGGHSHRAQPVVRYRNKIIAYSLGNFLFADRLINAPRSSWYPNKDDSIDYRFVERTESYPYVTEPTLVTFSSKDKIGSILNIGLGDQLFAKYDLICYENSNRISLLKNDLKQVYPKLYIIGQLTKFSIYPSIIYPFFEFLYKLKNGVPFKFLNLFINKSRLSI